MAVISNSCQESPVMRKSHVGLYSHSYNHTEANYLKAISLIIYEISANNNNKYFLGYYTLWIEKLSIFSICYDENYGKTKNYLSLQQLKFLLTVVVVVVVVVVVNVNVKDMLMLFNGAQTSL